MFIQRCILSFEKFVKKILNIKILRFDLLKCLIFFVVNFDLRGILLLGLLLSLSKFVIFLDACGSFGLQFSNLLALFGLRITGIVSSLFFFDKILSEVLLSMSDDRKALSSLLSPCS